MEIGHPDLVSHILEEIRHSGPITFARFMELALYHPRFGFYTDAARAAERIGWEGDYYTSSDVHPVLGRMLARQLEQMDARLGHPDPFLVIEMGPGKGLLARDILTACRQAPGGLEHRLQYLLIERSAALQGAQRRLLADCPVRVSWLESLRVLDPESIVGVLLSNELVDAFPVHRIRIEGGEPKEIHVAVRDGRFVEALQPLSTPALAEYLNRLKAGGVTLQEGATAEINLEACGWMTEVARVLGRGFVITIDYGHTASDLYGAERPRGTLVCYYRQMFSENPYERVGLQDMTAHVDFTMLVTVGEKAGLKVTGFTNQMSFLIGLGVETLVESLEPGSPEFQAITQLLRPDGMGRTFKVLIQHKGMPAPALDGLRYKSFWNDALTGGTSSAGRSPENRHVSLIMTDPQLFRLTPNA